jgi:hypothetical protein
VQLIMRHCLTVALTVAASWIGSVHAGVLPEDRADLLYHRYDGGGVVIDGPSLLVRKKFGEKFAASANYYIDMVSSASIDVQLISAASEYEEERTQKSASFDFLHGKATYSAGIINSEESDYVADTGYVSISQDMFGDLTTITMTYKRGWNDIFRNVKVADGLVRDESFAEQSDTSGYALGVTQILSRNLILAFNYEVLTDEGFLNSPYRSVRFRDPTAGNGFSLESEVYPGTHTSNAVSARLRYYLPYRAALDGQYRFFTDTWGVNAHTLELGYTHPARKRWLLDGRLRFYRQNAADFYSDLFPRRQFANFIARDKELSTFNSFTIGAGATYEFTTPKTPWIQKSTLNLRWDHLVINYDDFRDATRTDPANGILAGEEPLYSLDADVIQLFVSIWF